MSDVRKNFPFLIQDIVEESAREFPDSKHILIGSKKYRFPKTFEVIAPIIYNFKVRSDDVWLFGVPRSGTHLTQEIVWLMENNLNYKKAAENILPFRFHHLDNFYNLEESYKNVIKECHKYSPENIKIAKALLHPPWEYLAETTERRFIATHVPLSLAPKDIINSGCKVIYIARNPRDICLSSYKLTKSFTIEHIKKNEDFLCFWKRFLNGSVWYGPYFEHLKEGWELKNHENFLFLFYEDYIKDMRKTLLKIANFLGKKITDEELDVLEDHVKIDNFRKNKSVNGEYLKDFGIVTTNNFIRKDGDGGRQNYFTDEMIAETNKWIEENLERINLKFP